MSTKIWPVQAPILSRWAEIMMRTRLGSASSMARRKRLPSRKLNSLEIWSHFLRKTGIHFSGKCSGLGRVIEIDRGGQRAELWRDVEGDAAFFQERTGDGFWFRGCGGCGWRGG